MNDELKGKLRPVFEKAGVALAYLFGSEATGQATRASDVDTAVLFDEDVAKSERFRQRLNLMGAIERIVKKPVDVVVLNDTASLLLQYAVIKEGQFLYQRSEEARLDFEAKLLGRYFDYQPFLDDYNAHYVETHLQQDHRQARAAR